MPSVGSAVGYLTLDVSNFVSGMETAVTVAQSAFESMANTGQGKVSALGTALHSTGTLLTNTLTRPIIDLGSDIISTGSKFEQTLDTITAVTQKPGQSLVELEKQTNRLREAALELGQSTFFSAQEVADGMIIMGKAGWDTQDILDGMGGVLDASAASGENLNRVSEILVNSLTTMGEGAGEAARYADILTQAANAGTLNITDMGESMKYIGPTARTMGFDFEEVAGALLLMSQSGIKGSQAGTALNRVLTNLKHPVGQAQKAFDALGMSTEEFINGDGSFKSLSEILSIVRGHFDGLTQAERSTYSQMLAGQIGMKGLDTILNATDEDLEEFISLMYDSGGVAKETADIMRDNLEGRLDQFGDSIENLKLKIHQTLEPTLKSLVERLTAFVQGITASLTPSMVKWGAAIAAVTAAIGPLMVALGGLLKLDSYINGPISRVTQSFMDLSSKLNRLTLPINRVFKIISRNFTNLVPLAQSWVSGMVGQFRNGIATVGEIFGNLSKVYKDSTKGLGSSFSTTFTGIKSVATSVFKDITKPIRTVKEAFSSFNESFGAFSNSARTMLGNVKSFAGDVVGQVYAFGSSAAQAVGRVVGYVVNNSQSKILSLFKGLKGGVSQFSTFFMDKFSGMESSLNGFGLKINGFFQPLISSVSSFVNSYASAISGLPKMFSNKLVEIKAGFANLGPQLAASLSQSLSNAFPTIASGLRAYGDQIGRTLSGDFAPRFATAISNAFEDSSLVIAQSFSSLKKEFEREFLTLGPTLITMFDDAGEVIASLAPMINSAFSGVTQWMGVFGKSVSLLGNVFKVSFAGIALASIAAIVAGIIHLISTNDQVKESMSRAFDGIKVAWENLKAAFASIGEALAPVVAVFNAMFSAFSTQLGAIIVQTVQGIAQNIQGLADSINNINFDTVNSSLMSLQGVVQGVFSFALGMATTLSGILTGDLTTAWDGVKQMAQSFWDTLSNIAGLIDGAISSAFNGLADILRDMGFEETADALQHVGDNFHVVGDVVNFVKGIFEQFAHTLVSAFNNAKQAATQFVSEHKAQLDQIGATLVNIAAVVGGVFSAAWTNTFNTIANIVGTAVNTIIGVLGGVGNILFGIVNIVSGVWNVVSNVVMAIVSLLTGDIEGAFNHLGAATEGFGQIFSGVFDVLGGVVETFTSLASGAFNLLGDVVNGAANFIGDAVNNVVGWFSDTGDAANDMAGSVDAAMNNATGSVQAHEYAASNSLGNERKEISETISVLDEATANTKDAYAQQSQAASKSAQDTTSSVNDIIASFGDLSASADGDIGNVSELFGNAGFDVSQFATGVQGDTGVATASFEEMGAALDQLSAGSTQAAQVVAESFGNVATTVTQSIVQSTQGFTTFNEIATTTFTQAATMVTEFANNTNQALSSFGQNAVAAFSNMTKGVVQSLSSLPAQVSVSLAQTSAAVIQWAAQLSQGLAQAFNGLVQLTNAAFSQFAQSVAVSMQAAGNAVQAFSNAVTAVGLAVQASIGQTFQAVAASVAASCAQMVASVASFANAVSSAVNAMCANLMATVRAGFSFISATVRSQTTAMLSAITQFGSRTVSTMTNTMSRCRSAVQSGMTAMSSAMKSQLNQMASSVTQFGSQAASAMRAAMNQMLASVRSGCQQITNTFRSQAAQWISVINQFAAQMRAKGYEAGNALRNGLVSSLSGLSSQLYSIGLQAANGMANGVRAGAGGVVAAMRSIAAQAVAAAQSALKVASPSKVMRDEVGIWLPAGIAEGITENGDIVTYAMNDLAKNLIALSQDTTQDWKDESKKQLEAFSDSIKSSITKVGERLSKTWTDYFEQQLKENTESQNEVYREMARIESDYHKRIEQAKDKDAKDALEAERERLLTAQEERISTLKTQREEIQKEYDETSKDVAKFGTDVLDKFNDAMSDVADEAAAQIVEKFQKISEAAQEAMDEVNKKIEAMTSKLQSYGSLMSKQSDEELGDYWQLDDLRQQIRDLEKYGNNLEAIKDKVSDTLLSEIVAMDVEQATQYTNLLLSMTDEKLNEYNQLYERKQQIAADIANRFYADQVQQVKDNYLKELVNAYLETFDQISTIGQDTAKAFLDNFNLDDFSEESKAFAAQFERGIAEELGNSDAFKVATTKLTGNITESFAESFDQASKEIIYTLFGLNEDIADVVDLEPAGSEAGEEFAQALYTQAKDELGIHSPSTVFASLGQDTGQGFINGIMAVLTSGSAFELFAEATKAALDEFVASIEVSSAEDLMPAVEQIGGNVESFVTGLIRKLIDSIRGFFTEVKGMLAEIATFVSSLSGQFVAAVQSMAAGNDRLASSARSAASALRDQAAAVRELAAAQAAAATSDGAVATGGGKTGVPVSNVTNNYSTVINSPVKVSAIEATRSANRSMRSLAEGY